MKNSVWFSYAVKNYSKTYCISMKWFKVYIQILFPIKIILSILYLIISLGNIQNSNILYGTEWSGTIVFALIVDLIVFFLRCYTYISMKNLKSNGYQSNIVLMIAEIIIIAYTYLSISISYGIIPIAIYIIIWFVPNYIYFKKRQSIFSFMFSYPDNDNYEEPVYNNFDVFWTCPSCGIQNQSIKCSGCGLTKQEAEKINSEKLKQNEAVELIETKQKQGIETSNNTESAKSNELKFCNKCGSKLDDDFAFCNKCGNKVR